MLVDDSIINLHLITPTDTEIRKNYSLITLNELFPPESSAKLIIYTPEENEEKLI